MSSPTPPPPPGAPSQKTTPVPLPVPPPSPGVPPSPKTSSVPLKKETVRITLRAKPGGETPEAPAAAAPPPPAAPMRPAAPPPPVSRPAPPPAPMASKTIPLSAPPRPAVAAPGAPAAPAPAPAAPAAAPAPVAARPQQTAALTPGAAQTQPMPRATVKLQQPSAPTLAGAGAAVSSAPIKAGIVEEDDDSANEKTLNILAIVGTVLAAIVFLLALMSSDSAQMFVSKDPYSTDWKLPKADSSFAKRTSDGFAAGLEDHLKKPAIAVNDVPKAE